MLREFVGFTFDVIFDHKDRIETALFIISLILGLLFGVYFCFIGGIEQIVDACKSGYDSTGIAVGIFRIIITGFTIPIVTLGLVVIFTFIKDQILKLINYAKG